MMKCLRSREMMFTALLTLTLMSSAVVEDWNNPDEGDWFDPTNWTPNAVPTASTDTNINNGGTAILGEDAVDTAERNLNIGVAVVRASSVSRISTGLFSTSEKV